MKYAVVKNDFVVNIIVAIEEQKEELEIALNAKLEPCNSKDLMIGDFWNGSFWSRNYNGEQKEVPNISKSLEDRIQELEEKTKNL